MIGPMKKTLKPTPLQHGIFSFLLVAAMAACFPEVSSAESFFAADNPFLLLDDPILIGGESFSARIEAVRATRKPVGLVLSGGSARAFAHVGVLEALEEHGVRPDFVVANSMGAVVAILYAAGIAPRDIRLLIESYPVTELFDAAVPTRGGLLDARRFAAMIRELLIYDDLQDFPIPLMVVCEDIQSRRQIRLAAGEVGTTAVASFALPAIFDPVLMDGMRLIDGGVTNLVPVGVAAAYTDRIVAATSLYSRDLKLTNPVVILNRSIDLGKTRNAIAEMDALRPAVIRCAVEDVSYMDFDGVAAIVARGYESALAAMPEVLAVAGERQPAADAALDGARELHARRVRKLVDERRRGITYPLSPGALSWTPELKLFDAASGFGDVSRDRQQLGLRALWSSGHLRASAAAFARLDGGQNQGLGADAAAGDAGLSLGAAWRYAGAAELRAKASLDFAAGDLERDGGVRSVLWEAGAETRLDAPAGLVLTPSLRGEALTYLGPGDVRELPPALAEAALRIGSAPPLPGKNGKAAFFLSAAGFADEDGNFGPAWEAAAELPAIGILGFRLRSSGRLSAAGDGTPYRTGDGFRGPGGTESGYGSADEVFGTASFRSVDNVGINIAVPFLQTDLAESLLLQRVSVGAFVDRAFAASGGDSAVKLAAGIAAEVSISVFGLTPMGFSFFISRDLEEARYAWGIAAGFLFK